MSLLLVMFIGSLLTPGNVYALFPKGRNFAEEVGSVSLNTQERCCPIKVGNLELCALRKKCFESRPGIVTSSEIGEPLQLNRYLKKRHICSSTFATNVSDAKFGK